MRFGLFGGATARRGVSATESARGYHDVVELHVEAEALGFHGSFVTEHHFTKIGQVSATPTLLTWIAARTTTLRLGTAVIVLPWHDPVRLAESLAFLTRDPMPRDEERQRQDKPHCPAANTETNTRVGGIQP